MVEQVSIRGALRVVRAGAGLVGLLVLSCVWLLIPRRWPRLRRWMVLRCWGAIGAGLPLRIRMHGTPLAGPGVLFVANHVSWADIPALGRIIDAPFVAKGEVADWPVIGRLTAAYGCLFVDREARGQAGVQAAEIGGYLADGGRLILFPEGTTGLGDDVIPFRSSLFALLAAANGAMRVQPVTLRYRRPDGGALDASGLRAAAWIGDDELGPHVLATAQRGGAVVEVWFEDPIDTKGMDRKTLARATQGVISGRLRALNAAEVRRRR